jgi:hypothetical protein
MFKVSTYFSGGGKAAYFIRKQTRRKPENRVYSRFIHALFKDKKINSGTKMD